MVYDHSGGGCWLLALVIVVALLLLPLADDVGQGLERT